MKKIFTTKSIEERNDFIKHCYESGIKYSYSDKDKEGNYKVKYEE